MANEPRIYLDACCFIDVVKIKLSDGGVAINNLNPARVADNSIVKKLLQAARNGEIEVHTSTLTIAEVQHADEADGSVSEEAKRLIRGLLLSGNPVQMHSPDWFVCEDARDLRWKHGINLKGADAIHVATALSYKCIEFITTDGAGLLKRADKIGSLGLRVITASATNLLPDKYKQDDLLQWQRQKRKRPRLSGFRNLPAACSRFRKKELDKKKAEYKADRKRSGRPRQSAS